MVKALAFTDRGIEKVSSIEVEELTGCKCTVEDSCVLFDVKSFEELFGFIYYSQSTDRVMALLARIEFSGLEHLLKQAKEALSASALSDWLKSGVSFKFECERRGVHDFNSTGLAQELGGLIIEVCMEGLGFEPRVELRQPDVQFFAFVNNDVAYLGVDLCGKDLSKREYRIFTSRGMVNAKLAYAMVRLSGCLKNEKMIDLYSMAGIIAIEACLFHNKISAHKYNRDFCFKKNPRFKHIDIELLFKKFDSERKTDLLDITGFDPQLRNVEAAKKNAKLAGVDKLVRFSKLDLQWADIKLSESEVDLVISRIPSQNSSLSEYEVRKAYKELFHQAEYLLKSKGRLCVLSESLLIFKEMLTPHFEIVLEELLSAGKQEYAYLMLVRNEKLS